MKGLVYNNGELAGYLQKNSDGRYSFEYEELYFADPQKKAISLTLPKSQRAHLS